jgi:HEAT repeat protein
VRNPSQIAALALTLVSLAGCASMKLGSLSTAKSNPGPTTEEIEAYRDPIAASQLRERAIEGIEKLASAPIPEVRANALEAMEPLPARLESFIPAALRDENAGVRSAAAMMVGRARLVNVAPAARPLLNDPSPFVRSAAIYALLRNGLDVERSSLAAMLLDDPSPRVRAQAAFILGELRDPSARGPLLDAAKGGLRKTPTPELKMMQIQIAEALVKLGEQDQVQTVRAALYPQNPEDLEIAALAVQVIGELRDKSSASELINLTAFKDKQGNRMPAEIRLGAAQAMAKLGNTRGSFIADEFLTNPMAALRSQAAHVYGETGRVENLAKLEMLLNDPEARVRVAAAAAIVKVTSAQARTH